MDFYIGSALIAVKQTTSVVNKRPDTNISQLDNVVVLLIMSQFLVAEMYLLDLLNDVKWYCAHCIPT